MLLTMYPQEYTSTQAWESLPKGTLGKNNTVNAHKNRDINEPTMQKNW